MRAIRAYGYGGPEQLRLDDIPIPDPGPGQIRIRVRAAAINPIDCKIRAGSQRILIPQSAPFPVGMDCAGEVDALGPGASRLSVGDAVMTSPHYKCAGTYAEYICVAEDEVALKPENATFQEAAGLPLAGLTALQSLRAARVSKGDKILVQAGAGGVGTLAIQLARHMGAHVATTCSSRNADLVTDLGAQQVIDYRTQDFTQVLRDLDMVLDALGGPERARGLQVLRKGGRLASIVTDIPALTKQHGPLLGTIRAVGRLVWVTVSSRLRGRPVHYVVRKASHEDLRFLAQRVESGDLRPVVDRVFPLEAASEAHAYSETGRARGKIILDIP